MKTFTFWISLVILMTQKYWHSNKTANIDTKLHTYVPRCYSFIKTKKICFRDCLLWKIRHLHTCFSFPRRLLALILYNGICGLFSRSCANIYSVQISSMPAKFRFCQWRIRQITNIIPMASLLVFLALHIITKLELIVVLATAFAYRYARKVLTAYEMPFP